MFWFIDIQQPAGCCIDFAAVIAGDQRIAAKETAAIHDGQCRLHNCIKFCDLLVQAETVELLFHLRKHKTFLIFQSA